MRHGVPIAEYPLSAESKVNSGISFSPAYREVSACVAAGLDYSRWVAGGYTSEVRGAVLAWHSASQQIEAHANDAQIREQEKRRRKREKK